MFDLMAFLQQLVECEDKMARMQLIEDKKAEIDQLTAVAPDEGGEDWEDKYKELQDKYIKTFFSPKPNTEDKSNPDEDGDEKTDEEKRAESITIDDLYKK